MMVLAAVILLLAFVALAGMVARVAQLASQTTAEKDKALLDEIGPLSQSLDASICQLKASTITTKTGITATWTSGSMALSNLNPDLTASDIGMTIKGAGIPTGTRIVAIPSPGDTATMSQAATQPGSGAEITLTPCLPQGASSFGHGPTTTPALEDAIIEMLQHIRAIEARHGFWMEWRVECQDLDAAKGRAVVSLSDGTTWVEFTSTVLFPRPSACTPVSG